MWSHPLSSETLKQFLNLAINKLFDMIWLNEIVAKDSNIKIDIKALLRTFNDWRHNSEATLSISVYAKKKNNSERHKYSFFFIDRKS